MGSLTDLEPGSFTSLPKLSPQVSFLAFILELDCLKKMSSYLLLPTGVGKKGFNEKINFKGTANWESQKYN